MRIYLAIILCLVSCGAEPKISHSSEDSSPAQTGWAQISVEDHMHPIDSAALTHDRVEVCKLNPTQRSLEVTLTSDQGRLTFRIANLLRSAQSYQCLQASTNRETHDTLGQRFQNCMVSTSLTAGGRTYAMHRSTEENEVFTYDSSCQIAIDTQQRELTGSLACQNMQQTHAFDTPISSIDQGAIASIAATFRCSLEIR